MRGFFHGATDAADDLDEARQPRLHSVVLNPGAWGIGKTIADLGLDRFEVSVSVIRRRGIRAVSPSPEARFEAGDVVVLLGVPDGLAAGEGRLLKG
jgi:CPA2 family monovalent cation:H+ antiporter-2